MNKTLLLASFIPLERIEWFLEYLESKFNITKDKVFCYKNLDDESKVIITFKLIKLDGKQLNFKSMFPNVIPIHKKGDALYTINGLNKLIANMYDESIGNIDNKLIKIDWSQYQNKLLMINGEELTFLTISRVF